MIGTTSSANFAILPIPPINIKAANIATTTPTIPGLIPSKPLIPLIPAAIEFD